MSLKNGNNWRINPHQETLCVCYINNDGQRKIMKKIEEKIIFVGFNYFLVFSALDFVPQ